MKKLIPLILVIIVTSCDNKPNQKFPDKDHIIGLASPVNLDLGASEIFLSDYFTDPTIIDSVFIGSEKLNLEHEKSRVFYKQPEDFLPMDLMSVYINGNKYSIPVKRSKKVKYEFVFNPDGKNYSSVNLRGEFNGWTASKNPLKKENELWKTMLYLDQGIYQYQIVLDGEQQLDPTNPETISNNSGGFNSVLRVGETDRSDVTFLYTEDNEGNKVEVDILNGADSVFAFWQNNLLNGEMAEAEEDEIDITIPEQAERLERSFIRVWAYNQSGLSNDILIPLHYGKVLDNPKDLKRQDFHATVIYNVFVDRFFNADSSNDYPLNIPEVLPPADYHGGDIPGVTRKINEGYFTSLGVNTIWISPLVQNVEGAFGYWPEPESRFSGYHGYWPVSFTQVDYRFGDSEDLTKLVSTSHENDINFLLDFVANHVHEQHPVINQNPDWKTNLYLPDGRENTQLWDEQRLTTWFDTFLPTLNLEIPEITDMLSDSAVYWIEKYGIDGFRHDATKHIPEIFWRALTHKLKTRVIEAEGRPLYQIGETYGSPELISGYLGSGMLDAQFDFNVYDATLATIARGDVDFSILKNRLLQSFEYYGYHNLMGNISGNQDRGRFTSYAGGDLKFDEDAKAAGWTREIGVGDPVGYKRIRMLMAFNMTIPGIPVIYYGDEIGMPGGNDPDNRRMMRFEGLSEEEEATRETTAYLAKLRRNNLQFTYGDFIPVYEANGIFCYARKYFEDEGIVIFNNNGDNAEIVIEIPEAIEMSEGESHFGYEFSLSNDTLNINLPAYSFEIITSE